jgi:hypothetical protein
MSAENAMLAARHGRLNAAQPSRTTSSGYAQCKLGIAPKTLAERPYILAK